MPVLTLAADDLIAPTKLTLATIENVMFWPDDEAMRRRCADGGAAQFIADNVWDDVPLPRQTLMAMAEATPVTTLQELARPRIAEGMMAGYVVAVMVQRKVETLAAAKRSALKVFRGIGDRNFDMKLFDNIAWPRMRPVAHLWATYVLRMHATGDRTFPCRRADLRDFLTQADATLTEGIRCRPSRSSVTVLDRSIAWVVAIAVPEPDATIH